MTQREWLSSTGEFLFGKHKDRLPEDVIRSDRSYIRWIVDEVEDILEEDRQILQALLNRR